MRVIPAVSAALIDPDAYVDAQSQTLPCACQSLTVARPAAVVAARALDLTLSAVRAQAFKTMAAFIKLLESVSYDVSCSGAAIAS